MKKTILGATITAFAVMASPAFAQDEEKGFDGFYIGATVGHGGQPNDGPETIVFDTNLDGVYGDTVRTVAGANAFAPGFCHGDARSNSRDGGCNSDDDGFDYGIRAGYDFQTNSGIVFGGVLDASIGDSVDYATAFSSTPAAYVFSRKSKYQVGLRARVGYTPNNSTLFYGTGGVAYARMKNSFRTTNTANSFTPSGNSNASGYQLGGGVEQKLGRNFSIGFEMIHTSLSDDDYITKEPYVVRVGPGTAPATNPFLQANPAGTDMKRGDKDFNNNSIRFTAAFRF